jgi:hypothetical protein
MPVTPTPPPIELKKVEIEGEMIEGGRTFVDMFQWFIVYRIHLKGLLSHMGIFHRGICMMIQCDSSTERNIQSGHLIEAKMPWYLFGSCTNSDTSEFLWSATISLFILLSRFFSTAFKRFIKLPDTEWARFVAKIRTRDSMPQYISYTIPTIGRSFEPFISLFDFRNLSRAQSMTFLFAEALPLWFGNR